MNNKLTLPRTAWIALLASLTAVAPVLAQASTVVHEQTAVKNQSADQIFTNADIYGHRESDSIATHKGKIIFIGNQSQAQTFQEQSTDVIDLDNAGDQVMEVVWNSQNQVLMTVLLRKSPTTSNSI